jgi:hypothetical protein
MISTPSSPTSHGSGVTVTPTSIATRMASFSANLRYYDLTSGRVKMGRNVVFEEAQYMRTHLIRIHHFCQPLVVVRCDSQATHVGSQRGTMQCRRSVRIESRRFLDDSVLLPRESPTSLPVLYGTHVRPRRISSSLASASGPANQYRTGLGFETASQKRGSSQ